MKRIKFVDNNSWAEKKPRENSSKLPDEENEFSDLCWLLQQGLNQAFKTCRQQLMNREKILEKALVNHLTRR